LAGAWYPASERAKPNQQSIMARSTLAELDRKSVAVELVVKGGDRLLFGHGVYEADAKHGSRLRIQSSGNSGCALEICESLWNGTIHCGKPYGCDFLLRIA
jgi:hypothetical protein